MRKAAAAISIACMLLALSALCLGDIIYLNTGGVVKGKIVEKDLDKVVVRTPYGLTTIPMDDVDEIEEGGSLKEMYQERLKQIRDDDVDAHYNLGVWLRNVGMYEEAGIEFEKVIRIDPDHMDARCELGYVRKEGKWLTEEEYRLSEGYVKYNDRWVLKEEAEKLEAGYVKYRDEWVLKEELEMLKKGFRRLEGEWVSEEDYYKARGYVKYDKKWVTPEQAEKIKKRDEEREVRKKALDQKRKQLEGRVLCWDAQVYTKENVDEAWLERFAERVKQASAYLWKLTDGQAYIATATLTDQCDRGNWWIQNLDQNRVDAPGGQKAYAYCDFAKIVTGGTVDPYTVSHELGHLLWHLPDHYDGSKDNQCIMAGPKGAPKFCQDCLNTMTKKYPKWKFPNEGFEANPPETIIRIQDQ
jgi:tetratricopeptide (TPR) repeat protein